MKRHLIPVPALILCACTEHRVEPSTLTVPESGTFVSETGLIKLITSCPAGTEIEPEIQNCVSETEDLSRPASMTEVSVHYSGWTMDGLEFDSSVRRGAPASFGLHQVIPGWTEGLQTMVAGEKARFWIPQELAYDGLDGPPAGMLVFDVELISF